MNSIIQKNLDKKKWLESEKQQRDMSGEMPYCVKCDFRFPSEPTNLHTKHYCKAEARRSEKCLCAKAYNRLHKKK